MKHLAARRTVALIRHALLCMVVSVVMVTLHATDAHAQGSCSVPQIGSGSGVGQGVGSLLPGHGWIQASVFALDTRDQFGTTGVTEPYFAEGDLTLRSLLFTGAIGLVSGLEAWGQLSAHALDFSQVSGSRTRTGMGDVRLWLRAGPELLGIDESRLPVWLGLRAGVKLPASEFPIDAQIIPLTEGQKDAELALELGRAFAQGRYIMQAWGGHRWREENQSAAVRPGNEWFGYLAVSAATGRARVRVAAQILRGAPYESLGFPVATSRREMFELFPSVSTALGGGQIEVGARVPIAGRNLPTGNALTLSYSLGWGAAPSVAIEELFPSASGHRGDSIER